MKYAHIVSYVGGAIWALHPAKLAELVAVLAFRAAGKEFTDTEIAARIGDSNRASTSTSRGAVAVIPIRGVIANRMGSMNDSSGGTSCERIGAMIDAVAADSSIGTIVYDVDSSGGAVAGIQELSDKMFGLRGQVKQIAQINSMAASAAYWLASQCDERVCIPSGTAGSIGIYSAHQDLSKALEREGIHVTLISAGRYKTEGHPLGPLSPDALAVRQASVDEAYATFKKHVGRGLGVSPSAVEKGYGEGRALGAKDAKAAGLIDRIATMDETLGRLVGRSASSSGMRADDLRDTSVEGRARRAYLDALMLSGRGQRWPDADRGVTQLHAEGPTEGQPAELKPQPPPDLADPNDIDELDLTAALTDQARRHRLL